MASGIKFLHVGATVVYIILCIAHLFVLQSKIIALVVYSPLIFVNLVVWSIIVRMSIEMYKINMPGTKII